MCSVNLRWPGLQMNRGKKIPKAISQIIPSLVAHKRTGSESGAHPSPIPQPATSLDQVSVAQRLIHPSIPSLPYVASEQETERTLVRQRSQPPCSASASSVARHRHRSPRRGAAAARRRRAAGRSCWASPRPSRSRSSSGPLQVECK